MKHNFVKQPLLLIFTLTLFSMGTVWGQTQSLDDQDVINVEGLYKTSPSTQKNTRVEEAPQSAPTAENAPEKIEESQPVVVEEKVEELKDLSRLSPFREVSVIQKKFLPKTERFQFYGGLGTTTNTPWFVNTGAKLGLSYNLTEAFGLEFTGMFIASSEREVAKEIREQHNLKPEQFVYTKSFVGADLVWTPIYGKISYLDDRIVPFDMYFSVGAGQSNTNSVEKDVTTLHIGTGQIFAITKAIAFRWDYSLNMFQATPTSDPGTPAPSKGNYNDLILTAGVSFFFPEAKYR